jgi:hypothetical protein
MKKYWMFGACVAFASLLALVFSGCPTEEDPASSAEKIQITITGLESPPIPTGSQYYSLSVFREAQDIKHGETLTLLGGQAIQDGLTGGPSSGSVGIPLLAIPDGDYILVLGASPDMSGTEGKMFITGTVTGSSVNPKKVRLNSNTTVPFAEFAGKDASSGWTVDEIVEFFGTP